MFGRDEHLFGESKTEADIRRPIAMKFDCVRSYSDAQNR